MSNTDQKRSITDQQQALIYYIYKIGDITVKVALSSSSLPWSQPSNQKLFISCCQKQNLQNECQVMLSATIKLLILWISDIFMSNLNYVQETFWKKKQWIILIILKKYFISSNIEPNIITFRRNVKILLLMIIIRRTDQFQKGCWLTKTFNIVLLYISLT